MHRSVLGLRQGHLDSGNDLAVLSGGGGATAGSDPPEPTRNRTGIESGSAGIVQRVLSGPVVQVAIVFYLIGQEYSIGPGYSCCAQLYAEMPNCTPK